MKAIVKGSCFVLALPLALAGCMNQVPLRASSTYVLTEQASRATLPASEAETVALLSTIVGERGFYRTARYDVARDVRYYTWRSDQQPHVRGAPKLREMPDHEVGSWLLARVDMRHPPLTEILLIAKPTVDGREICADSDSFLQEAAYHCVDTMVKSNVPPEKLPNGTEEAELVGYALRELKTRFESR